MVKQVINSVVFLLLCVFVQQNSYGQTILIKDEVPEDFSIIDGGFGPNRIHYVYSYFRLGKVVSTTVPDTTLAVRWNALSLASGRTYKQQFNKWVGGLLDVDLSVESYALNQLDSSTVLNYVPAVRKARYVFYKVSAGVGFQFNFKPNRGNQLGTYLTLEGYLDYNIAQRFVVKTTYEQGYKVDEKSVYRKLSFVYPFQYGAIVKLGKHSWCVFAKYRVSNAFDNGQLEIPRLIVGLDFLLHKKG